MDEEVLQRGSPSQVRSAGTPVGRLEPQNGPSFADIEASLGEILLQKAQALAARWKELVAGFTGGDPGIQKGLNAMYADNRLRADILANSSEIQGLHHEGHGSALGEVVKPLSAGVRWTPVAATDRRDHNSVEPTHFSSQAGRVRLVPGICRLE